jgi:hypothetical protein
VIEISDKFIFVLRRSNPCVAHGSLKILLKQESQILVHASPNRSLLQQEELSMSFGNTHLHWKAKPAMWFPGTKKQKQKVRYVIVNPRVLLIVNQEVEIIREKRKKELRKNFTL